MSDKVFGAEEKAKLIQIVNEGVNVLQEVTDLQEGLRDTVKAVAEEMEIKPAVLTKAVNIAFKESLSAEREDFEYLETILEAAKKA